MIEENYWCWMNETRRDLSQMMDQLDAMMPKARRRVLEWNGDSARRFYDQLRLFRASLDQALELSGRIDTNEFNFLDEPKGE